MNMLEALIQFHDEASELFGHDPFLETPLDLLSKMRKVMEDRDTPSGKEVSRSGEDTDIDGCLPALSEPSEPHTSRAGMIPEDAFWQWWHMNLPEFLRNLRNAGMTDHSMFVRNIPKDAASTVAAMNTTITELYTKLSERSCHSGERRDYNLLRREVQALHDDLLASYEGEVPTVHVSDIGKRLDGILTSFRNLEV